MPQLFPRDGKGETMQDTKFALIPTTLGKCQLGLLSVLTKSCSLLLICLIFTARRIRHGHQDFWIAHL